MLYPKVVVENTDRGNLLFRLARHSNHCGVLNQVIIRCNQNTFTFSTTNEDITQMKNNLKLSDFTVRKILKDLVDLDIIVRIGKGLYRINKEFVHLDYKKASWKK